MKKKLGPQTLLYPLPATLIGSLINEKPNFMTAAWCSICSHKPPSICVAIHKSRYTLEGIKENQTFSVNIPNRRLVEKVDFCGTHTGRKEDKSRIFKVFYGRLKTAPMIEDCPLSIECKLRKIFEIDSHVIVIGEIVETYIDEECITEGKPDPKKIDPIVYLTSVRKYATLGEYIADAFKK